MRNPEERSPRVWAAVARARVSLIHEAESAPYAWMLSTADCIELSERMDDLSEALRLLKLVEWPYEQSARMDVLQFKVNALLAKYEEGQNDE